MGRGWGATLAGLVREGFSKKGTFECQDVLSCKNRKPT